MIPTLPFDVITMILLMLPAEALVKLQCVCTGLRDMIRDPTFIKKQLQVSASKGTCFLLHKQLENNGHRVFRLLYDKVFNRPLDIVIPLDIMPNNFIIVGSFNGLLCLADVNCFAPTIYICNPSIRKYRAINFPITDFTIGSSFSHIDVNVALGFGYHDKNDDYKIVRIVSSPVEVDKTKTDNDQDVGFATLNKTKVEVYSLVERLWKAVDADSFKWELFDARSDVVVNESIHWKAIYQDKLEDVLVILAFHLGEYVFRQLGVPNYLCDGEDLMEYVAVYKGNLSLFVFHLADQVPWDEKCYLWVMSEYGDEGSWTKVHSVTISPGVVVPHTITPKGEIIYENGRDETVVYHFDTNMITLLLHGEEQAFYGLATYVDSVVMIGG